MTHSYKYGCLKWPGGKQKLLSRLFRTIPKEGHRLIEPFAGSASLSINSNYDEYVLADLNGDLIGLYQDLVSNLEELKVRTLELFERHNNESDYYLIRTIFNSTENGVSGVQRSAIFMYLCRHGFKGLVRYSKKSGFNVPFGGYKKPYFPEVEMDFFSIKFKDATIIHSGFQSLLNSLSLNSEDVCFCDPPYLPLSKSSNFVHYTAEGFKQVQHTELDRLSYEARQQGASIYICNHNVKLLDELYVNYADKKRFRVGRSIAAKSKKHKKAPEVLLSY